MNTRTYLVIAAVVFYLYWFRQSAVSTGQLAAAGTPTGTDPVSTVATSPVSPTTNVDPITAIFNSISNAVGSAPTTSTTPGTPTTVSSNPTSAGIGLVGGGFGLVGGGRPVASPIIDPNTPDFDY